MKMPLVHVKSVVNKFELSQESTPSAHERKTKHGSCWQPTKKSQALKGDKSWQRTPSYFEEDSFKGCCNGDSSERWSPEPTAKVYGLAVISNQKGGRIRSKSPSSNKSTTKRTTCVEPNGYETTVTSTGGKNAGRKTWWPHGTRIICGN